MEQFLIGQQQLESPCLSEVAKLAHALHCPRKKRNEEKKTHVLCVAPRPGPHESICQILSSTPDFRPGHGVNDRFQAT